MDFLATFLKRLYAWLLGKIALEAPGISSLFFGIVFFLFLYMGAFIPSRSLLMDSDIAWLIRTGQWILEHGQIPHHNVLGMTQSQQAIPWVCYQWLFESVVGGLFNLLGLHGVSLLGATLCGLIVFSISRWLQALGFRPLPEVMLSLLTALFFLAAFAVTRPYLVSFLFFITLLRLLQQLETRPSGSDKTLVPWTMGLPVLFLVWTNSHLAFIAGMALFAIWSLRRFFTAKNPKYVWLLGGTFAVTLLNPYGIELYPYLLNLGNSPALNAAITELQPLYWYLSKYPAAWGVILFSILNAFLGFKDRRLSFEIKIGYLFSLVLMLFASRHMYFFCIFSMPMIAAGTSALLQTNVFRSFSFKHGFLNRLPDTSLIWVILMLVTGVGMAQGKLFPARLAPEKTTLEAIHYFQESSSGSAALADSTVLTSAEEGSYLIFYSDTRSYLDTRFDMYGNAYVAEMLKAYHQLEGWEAVFKRYDIRRVLYRNPEDTFYIQQLESRGDWRIRWQGKHYILLERVNPWKAL